MELFLWRNSTPIIKKIKIEGSMNIKVAEMKCKVFNEVYPEGSKVLYFNQYSVRNDIRYYEGVIRTSPFVPMDSKDNKPKIQIKLISPNQSMVVFLDTIIPIN